MRHAIKPFSPFVRTKRTSKPPTDHLHHTILDSTFDFHVTVNFRWTATHRHSEMTTLFSFAPVRWRHCFHSDKEIHYSSMEGKKFPSTCSMLKDNCSREHGHFFLGKYTRMTSFCKRVTEGNVYTKSCRKKGSDKYYLLRLYSPKQSKSHH